MSRQVLLIFAQALFCMGLVLGEEPAGSFGVGGLQPIFQPIRGLPSNQHGFIITQPNYQNIDSKILSQEQQVQLKVQEAFRKAVEDANRLRINEDVLRPSQGRPKAVETQPQVELVKEKPVDNTKVVSDQLPPEKDLIQHSASERLESIRSPPAELIIPKSSGDNFKDDISSQSQFDAKKMREQAENARYSFKSAISDSINDHSHIRQEIRDGLKLKGLYSYSDGYFKRTVHYVADENGYRVINEESEPIGTGPQINPLGQVDVSSQIAGRSLEYTIKGENLPPPFQKKPKVI